MSKSHREGNVVKAFAMQACQSQVNSGNPHKILMRFSTPVVRWEMETEES